MTFGAYIRQKREETGISLRKLAEKSGISAIYLSEIETNKKQNPSYEILAAIVQNLPLTENETYIIFDLHAKVNNCASCDVNKYIMNHDIAKKAIREAEKSKASDDDWNMFIEKISTKK